MKIAQRIKFHAELWLPWQPKGKTLKIILSQSISPRAQIFGVQHCLVELYQDCPNYGPGVKIGPAPGVSSFQQKYIVKPLNIILSETTITRTQIFDVQHCLVELYQDCPNYGPGVKIGPAPGVSSFQQKYIVKPLNIILSETTITRTQIFDVQHCLVELYQDCPNYGPGVKIGPAPGVSSFQQKYIVKPLKIILSETTITRAQIYGMQHCLVDLYQDCPNLVPWVKIGPTPGVSSFQQKYIVKPLKSSCL